MTKDLRLELRALNNALWHAIHDTHASVAAFCRAHPALNDVAIGQWLNLTKSPWIQRGSVVTLAMSAARACEATGLAAEVLFPPALYASIMRPRVALELESRTLLPLVAARGLEARTPSPLDAHFDGERANIVHSVLQTLAPRERHVLERRFGLHGGEALTLEQIGKQDGIGGERVRQIEVKALCQLRHASRYRKLLPFIEHR